jgi:chloramphenicol 3-O-phosphotransferase
MAQASIVVITGPPGAGKTTVSGLVAETIDPSVHVEGDAFWHFIRRGYIEPWRVESRGQNRVVVRALARAADTYAAGGYTVILDCILGPWFVEEFLADLSSPAPPVDYLVLRPSLDVALQRATSHTEDRRSQHGRPLGSEPARRMYEQFADLGIYERHVVDCTAQTPHETAHVIERLLEAGSVRLTAGRT